MNKKVKTIDELLCISEQELLERFNEEVLGEGMEAFPRRPKELRAEFYAWVEVKREVVCRSKAVIDAEKHRDRTLVVAAVADALGGSGFITAAVLMVRMGLNDFCRNIWGP